MYTITLTEGKTWFDVVTEAERHNSSNATHAKIADYITTLTEEEAQRLPNIELTEDLTVDDFLELTAFNIVREKARAKGFSINKWSADTDTYCVVNPKGYMPITEPITLDEIVRWLDVTCGKAVTA